MSKTSELFEVNELIEVFCGIRDAGTMRRFFDEIFTSAEKHDLAMRWQLMKMINDDIPQRQIAAQLRISLCKITRGAKVLKDDKSVTKKILSGVQKKKPTLH